jgi:maltose O-acetyltransferase
MSTPYSANVRVGTPKGPDSSQFAHMSEKEKMLGGWPFAAFVPELIEERTRCQQLCIEYGTTAPHELTRRRDILGKLLHPECKDKTIWIEPPFHMDYGYNVKVGSLNTYVNLVKPYISVVTIVTLLTFFLY